MTIKSHRELKVWERAMDLVAASYKVADLLPKSELYGLAAPDSKSGGLYSGEHCGGARRKGHLGDYLRHSSVANGSLMEWRLIFGLQTDWRIFAWPKSERY